MRIVIFSIIGALIALALGAWGYYKYCASKGRHYVALGYVSFETKTRFPFLSRYMITYSMRGKPFTATTKLVRKGSLKVGVKAMWEISTFKVGNVMFRIAIPPKSAKKSTSEQSVLKKGA